MKGCNAIKYDRVEIAFILALFHWLEPFTDVGREETEVLENKKPTTSFSTCDILEPENSTPNRDYSIGGRRLLGTITPRVAPNHYSTRRTL